MFMLVRLFFFLNLVMERAIYCCSQYGKITNCDFRLTFVLCQDYLYGKKSRMADLRQCTRKEIV
jgi:hypothetical protein